jgi:cytochrome c oxidase cbb3-type subunit 3/ubiquinol-cytochrome c reductase cytochrome c subunit
LDTSYLALVSNQSLRSLILTGRPDEDVPDWRSYITGPNARALTSQEVDDMVAWLAGHREDGSVEPGQGGTGQAFAQTSAKPAAMKEAK